jgi:hypothetical protein
MSEAVTLTSGATGTVYGSLAAALLVLDTYIGDEYTAFIALSANDRKRAQLAARRVIDALVYIDTADTFTERDALQADSSLPSDQGYPFRVASYLLAALGAADSDVFSLSADEQQVTSVAIAGASLSLSGESQSATTLASRLPPDVLALLAPYLDDTEMGGLSAVGGRGQEGSDCNPFSTDRSGRNDPW